MSKWRPSGFKNPYKGDCDKTDCEFHCDPEFGCGHTHIGNSSEIAYDCGVDAMLQELRKQGVITHANRLVRNVISATEQSFRNDFAANHKGTWVFIPDDAEE